MAAGNNASGFGSEGCAVDDRLIHRRIDLLAVVALFGRCSLRREVMTTGLGKSAAFDADVSAACAKRPTNASLIDKKTSLGERQHVVFVTP
jgi:hypothetical protein